MNGSVAKSKIHLFITELEKKEEVRDGDLNYAAGSNKRKHSGLVA